MCDKCRARIIKLNVRVLYEQSETQILRLAQSQIFSLLFTGYVKILVEIKQITCLQYNRYLSSTVSLPIPGGRPRARIGFRLVASCGGRAHGQKQAGVESVIDRTPTVFPNLRYPFID